MHTQELIDLLETTFAYPIEADNPAPLMIANDLVLVTVNASKSLLHLDVPLYSSGCIPDAHFAQIAALGNPRAHLCGSVFFSLGSADSLFLSSRWAISCFEKPQDVLQAIHLFCQAIPQMTPVVDDLLTGQARSPKASLHPGFINMA